MLLRIAFLNVVIILGLRVNIINKVIELHVLGVHIKIENIVIWN